MDDSSENNQLTALSTQCIRTGLTNNDLDPENLRFLAKLPVFLNSSLDNQKVIAIALEHIQKKISAEATTVFLLDKERSELLFWAIEGQEKSRLEGQTIPSDRGIAGWVTDNVSPLRVANVQEDERFFNEIDLQGNFTTKSVLCTPLVVDGNECIGAIQVLNKVGADSFSDQDETFLDQFSHQVALAIQNAKLYQEAQDKTEALRTLDKRKSDMISTIAHEFRTPLNIIQNSAELCASPQLSEEQREQTLEMLRSGVSRLTKLITEIKNISLVQDEKLPLNKAAVSVNSLFDEQRSKFAEVASERSQKIDFNVQNPELEIIVDHSLFRIVLHNLISNAIRFTPDGGEIKVQATTDNNGTTLIVQDNGIGMNESDIPVIFEKFYEIADSMHHSSGSYEFKSGGLGLGLAAVRHILDAHDARYQVKSEVDKGTSFEILL